jgi:cytochrome c biogenesis protein CcdA
MNNGNLYDKVFSIFGFVMVFFYLGLGYYLIFSPYLNYIDKPLRVIIGVPLIIYGIYRAITSFQKIKDNFFSKDDDGDDDK